jgi:hypothetical protein
MENNQMNNFVCKEFYPEIVLEGENFSPKSLVQKFGVHVEKANERGDYNPRLRKPYHSGYCILRPNGDINGQAQSIPYLLEQYELIHLDGLAKLGIETATFYLVVSTLQNHTSIPCIYLEKIYKYFEYFNISMVSDENI